MNLIRATLDWWQRPPARQRIIDAMSPTDWKSSLDIIKSAKVSIPVFYRRIFALEAEGVVESKWEQGQASEIRGGNRRRLYRRAVAL